MMANARSFDKPGAGRNDLEEALDDRLRDAETLQLGGRHASAIAMGLYALEISLKIAICRRLELDRLPFAFQIHDLKGLLVLSGLSNRMKLPSQVEVKSHWDYVLSKYQDAQINDLRYKREAISGQQVQEVLKRIGDKSRGIVQWVSAQT